MPQKTKKEKIIAEYRRRLQMLQKHEVTVPRVSPSQPLPTRNVTPQENDFLIISYFKSDFTKSLILIAAVIALEISLYFANINNYFKLGR